MKSSWDETKINSRYHFDTKKIDPKFDTVIKLGQFSPSWDKELTEIIRTSQPTNWANRGYKGKDEQAPAEDLAAEEYDMSRVGMDPKMVITHLNWNIPPVLQKMSDLFMLKDVMNRIHVQHPGEMWNLHLDKLYKWCPEDPSKVLRVMVQLTDWQPGQFWEYGNYHHSGWSAGEVTTFDWQNVPHSTANAGHHPRVTFQITGVKTPATDAFLELLARAKSITV
jgi:hypothetical protein